MSFKITSTPKSLELLQRERKYSAHNYTPMPIVFDIAQGIHVTDVDGNEFLDFGAAYSAVNTGHNHPKIVEAIKAQYDKCALPARAFTHSLFADFCETLCTTFGFERVLPMNGGGEAVEFAIKLCRSWGYVKKKIPPNEAKVMMVANNFHGRLIGVTSGSTNPSARKNYGPFVPGVGASYGDGKTLMFNDVAGLEECFKLEGDKIAGVIIETVQGEAGVYPPNAGYLDSVRELCTKYNVLWCADEIQMGSYRCGPKRWAYENTSSSKPDVLITAKSITGGLYPVSVVCSSSEIMDSIEPNTHGSTYSGSPIGCAATLAALKVYEDEKLGECVAALGPYMLEELHKLVDTTDLVEEVRGVGLIAGVDLNTDLLAKNNMTVWHACMFMRAMGIACKEVHSKTIRFCPPLVVTKAQIDEMLAAFRLCCEQLPKLKPEEIPGVQDFHFLAH
ncbi:hypothetical protein OGAPHI_001724 [Ogataea philodendri]|uniref:Ornithine aminotransferase n=1 Tax=Ogataea philodendri TaxID=1378263 RepID=A0A9P8T7A8_9ASCO|nr:uncharacterized protein OGAPHI_001724 [Ogataea philodendri]KAH3667970.1 hypothetical protein OGAPHI_001724 [Ogataea philodendri]